MLNGKKTLVAYFSASGVTKRVAESLAQAASAELFEIKPEIPYTSADLNWTDKKARSTIEMKDPASRPAILERLPNMDDYDVVFIGFPIWWYVAPTIILTFLESYDFSGKMIVPFATSGGSGFGKTVAQLSGSCSASTLIKTGGLLNGRMSKAELTSWIAGLGL